MQIEGMTVLVVGTGKSGIAATELLISKGIDTVLFDGNKELDVDKLYKDNPKYFNKIKDTWNKDLKDLEVNIKPDLIIKSISSTENSVEVLDDKE